MASFGGAYEITFQAVISGEEQRDTRYMFILTEP